MQERTLRTVVYLAAGIGLIASIFAAAEVLYPGLSHVCTINGFVSCSKVATSGKTYFFGVPDFAWGIAGFVAILALAALAEQEPRDRPRAHALLILTTAGVGLAVYLLYVELAEIHALCAVCATAYVMGVIAWAGAIALDRAQPTGPMEEWDDLPEDDPDEASPSET